MRADSKTEQIEKAEKVQILLKFLKEGKVERRKWHVESACVYIVLFKGCRNYFSIQSMSGPYARLNYL